MNHFKLIKIDATPSTSSLLREMHAQKLLSGPTIVWAKPQTQGRGERDRAWISPPGENITLSVYSPLEGFRAQDAARLNMAASMLLIDWLAALDLPDLCVKWPNDILIWHAGEHRKVAGILVENMWRGSQWAAAVVGVGINVDSSRLTRSYPAVSLSEAWNVAIDPAALARSVGEQLVQRLNAIGHATSVDYHAALFARGETRTFVVHEREWRGRLLEINEDGLGRFEWEVQPEVADKPPAEWLPSSEVQWCW